MTTPPGDPGAVPDEDVRGGDGPARPGYAEELAAAQLAARFQILLASRRTPLVTPTLIGLNVLMFALMTVSGVGLFTPDAEEVLRWGADYGPLTFGGEPWRVLSNAFVHFGVIHIGFNMFVLWQIGGLVERLFGRLNFAVMYLVAALGGSLLSLFMHPYTVSAGASGAVFGVYGAFLAYLLRQRGTIPPPVLSKLRSSTLVFLGFNLIMGFSIKQIDNSAHLGGLFAGFGCGWLMATPLHAPLRKRAAVAVAAIALVITTALLALQPAPGDFLAELRYFDATETTAMERFKDVIAHARAKDRSGPELAEQLETEVLAPWKTALDRLRRLDGLPAQTQTTVERLRDYAAERYTGWTLLAAALRSGMPADMEVANAAAKRAQALLDAFNADFKAPSQNGR